MRGRRAFLALLLLPALGACAGIEAAGRCEGLNSVAGYVINLSVGIDNRAEDQYAQFRADSVDAYDVAAAVAEGRYDASTEAMDAGATLARDLKAFIDAMDTLAWDASVAATSTPVYTAWEAASSAESLARANIVEAAIIEKCGLPDIVDTGGDGPVVLPFPSVPSPTATDPPTSGVDDDAEALAMGRVLAQIYRLDLDDDRTLCLGRQLQAFENMTSVRDDASAYDNQFQRAFDNCGIDFTVPAE